MNKILFSGLVLASSLYAITIKQIKFDGLIHLSPSIAKEIMNLHVGDALSIEVVDKGIQSLYKQKFFKDISVSEENGILTVFVVEKPVIANIDIAGVGDNDKKALKDVIAVKKGEIYDKSKVEFAKKRIEKYYEGKGYFNTVVEDSIKKLNKNSLALDLIINRGEKIVIEKVKLCGAKKFNYSDIRSSVANRQKEFLSWMWGFDDGEVKLGDLPYDPARIRDYYLRHGYLDVKVSNPFLKAYMDSYSADLTYSISEGEQYKVKKVDIIAPKGLLDVKKVLSNLRLQPGQMFSSKRLRKDIASIQDDVADLGYAYVRVNPDVKTHKKKHNADIIFIVNPGQKVYINNVIISGNTKTIDRVVRREVYLAPGDLYNRTDLKDSRSALKRTGYFEDANIKEVRVGENKINLLVTVKEARTASIGGGIGYGSSDGILLSANLSDGNIFGSGIKATFNIDRSNSKLSGKISLTNPRVFDSIYSLSGSIYRSHYNYSTYDQDTAGFNISVGRKFGRFWRGSVGYTLESSKLSNLSSTLNPSLYTTNTTIKSAITPGISFNNTDDYYLPRRGMDTSLSVEYAGIGGDEKFVSTRGKFAYFYGLEDKIDYDLILRYRASFRYIIDNGYLPIGEKVYMGGVGTVRGYASRSISPKNSSGDLLGGKMMLANSIEASFPLIERLKLRGALFLDYGMTGENSLDIKRAGTGLSLEWVSPMGPINLIFASPLLQKAGDSTSSFEFTMGRQF
ncbi:MAG: outer membrane protein assembly factor BamA [Sulfurospirillum sp.]